MTKISYAGYRFPPVIIQHAVWLYARFTLSFRDVEDLLAERGINGLLRDGPSLGETLRTRDRG
jgi:transposase-like protein